MLACVCRPVSIASQPGDDNQAVQIIKYQKQNPLFKKIDADKVVTAEPKKKGKKKKQKDKDDKDDEVGCCNFFLYWMYNYKLDSIDSFFGSCNK